ncbi:MAG: hypothetical protein NT040_19670 [Bacteroidetes bacterium]|nr:hypothetical protein [Bacteroidota bacterium]
MLIYRFRITCEEHDGFLREIEIQPNQTFLDFHHIMLDSSELLHCERASFFMTDKKYKKDKEISLKAEKRQVRKYDEDLDQVVTESITLPLMKTEKLKHYIEDPHQKMIYEFIGRDIFSFHIELFKIFPSDGMPSFPRCIKRVAELPKKAEQPAAVAEAPVAPKIVIPKVPLPKLQELVKFDDIVEDEHELAAIENELSGLIEEEEEETVMESSETEENGNNDFLYGEHEETEEDEKLDHLEDYEDIESLDKRLSGFDHDSDDY